MESRSYRGTVEIRQGPDGQAVITGYAAVFNRDSADMGFLEQVDPRAFDKTLQEADVRGLGNHEANWLLGRTKAGTLRLQTDSIGLRYEIDVNADDPDGQRALAKVRRGDMDGSSFSFNTIRDEWNWESTPPQRRLLEVALIDVGPVTFPAYPDSSAAARALEPIAKKTGHSVDKLVAAMGRGEIRSLIDKQDTEADMEPWAARLDEILADAEQRVGKTLSAKSLERIRAAMDNLRVLLAGSVVDGDDDDGTLLGQALEMDSAPMVDVELRMRELAYRGEELAAV